MFQQAPKSITASGTLNESGVDVEMNAKIEYGDNRFGNIKTSAVKTLKNSAKIVGTKGQITVRISIKNLN